MRFVPLTILLLLGPSLLGTRSHQESPPPPRGDAATPPTRVYVVVDRFREFGGVLVREDEESFVIRRDDREETYERDKVLGFLKLMDLPADGRAGVVLLRDGGSIEGLVIEDGFSRVTLLIEGIHHQIPRDEVSHIVLRPSFEEELATARAAIDPEDATMRLALAEWIIEQGRLELARDELESLLRMEDNPRARQMLEQLQARIELQRDAGRTALPLPTEKTDRTEGIPPRVLTAEDVNLIRVYEIDFQRPPTVEVESRTIRKLIENHATNQLIPNQVSRQQQLYAMSDIEKVKLIFDVQARELYPEITVKGEPHSLNLFRTKVHNAWLIRNCATSGCHGGTDAGTFFLHRYGMNTPKTVYENLLILERTELEGPHKLIDYENPTMSLLIQYALPASEARIKHPPVSGYRPAFPSGGGKTMADTLAFIEAMYQPRPNYPVDYTPPQITSPTPPADSPRVPR
ncbi:MAG: DUF4398 domain-containing protein [Planctomycetota bacterium]|nr:DUF4398 domain-containing protein [Planctomycetota bacterium]